MLLSYKVFRRLSWFAFKVKDNTQLESATITGMSDEQIASTFGLIPFAVVIERFTYISIIFRN